MDNRLRVKVPWRARIRWKSLTLDFPPATPPGLLTSVKQFVVVALLAVVVTGCAPKYINLTSRRVPRVTESVYPFEVQWETPRRSGSKAEVKAYVVIDTQVFPMTKIPNTEDRWEAQVPLPAEKSFIPYRFKFDYDYLGNTGAVHASDRSPQYYIIVPRN